MPMTTFNSDYIVVMHVKLHPTWSYELFIRICLKQDTTFNLIWHRQYEQFICETPCFTLLHSDIHGQIKVPIKSCRPNSHFPVNICLGDSRSRTFHPVTILSWTGTRSNVQWLCWHARGHSTAHPDEEWSKGPVENEGPWQARSQGHCALLASIGT